MISFSLIVILTLGLIVYGIREFQKHQSNIYSIPIRIHVNGTRGKSSITRLIGSGLREGGIKTVTKVTGTFPRLILTDGTESVINRKSGANILEQLSIIKYCAKNNTEALVIECMALQPAYQRITEEQMIHSTLSVIANIRLDHLDIMGPGIKDVGIALSNTIPKNGILFTSEKKHQKFLKHNCVLKNTEFHLSSSDSVSDKEMKGFKYIEHKENVAISLDICEHVGVDRKTALNGMKKMIPDEGVLSRNLIFSGEKQISFFNAFAANDPESSLIIWNNIQKMVEHDMIIMLITIRKDRQSRALQLIELASSLEFDYLVLIGETNKTIKDKVNKFGIPINKIIIEKWHTSEIVYQNLLELSQNKTTIVGVGNMGAMGAEVSQIFRKNQIKQS